MKTFEQWANNEAIEGSRPFKDYLFDLWQSHDLDYDDVYDFMEEAYEAGVTEGLNRK